MQSRTEPSQIHHETLVVLFMQQLEVLLRAMHTNATSTGIFN